MFHGDSVTLAYEAGGRLTERFFPNGASTRYTYNADNTLAQVVNLMGSTVLTQHDYTYDGVRNRQTHTENIGGTVTPYKYVYDPLNRLTEVRNNTTNALIEGYSYDVLGNRLSKTDSVTNWTYLYDLANQLTEIRAGGMTQTTLAYDLNGNLSSRVDGSLVTSYLYDPENRLVTVTNTSTGTSGTYAYDDQGRRVSKITGAIAANYLYDGPDIVGEYDSTWVSPTVRYMHGAGVDDPLLRTTITDTTLSTQYYHSDGLGSIVASTNPDGTTAGTSRYDAWGNKLASAGSIPLYGYTGREPDETGLIYYRARYYDPTLGRFTQRDPIGLQGGLNQYAYVGGNPVNLRDPFGDRPLTEGEKQLLKPIFNETINYNLVDIQSGANWNPIAWIAHVTNHPAITLGNTIYVKTGHYHDDFAGAGLTDQSILVHEVAHVWQKQTNPEYSEIKAGLEGLKGKAAYQYVLSPPDPGAMAGPMKPLNLYGGFEQQAQIVQDYFLNSQGVPPLGNQDLTAGPQTLNYGYEQTLGPVGLGPAANTGTGDLSPGDQSLPALTRPPAGTRAK